MTTLFQAERATIADCLQQCGKAVRTIDGGGWEFTLRGEAPLTVAARLKKGWLRLCSPLSAPSLNRPTPAILDRMLAKNVELAGGAKFTLADDPLVPQLSAELLWDEGQSDLGVKIAGVCDGFSQAFLDFTAAQRSSELRRENAPAACDKEEVGELTFDAPALCKEMGWPTATRAGDQVLVELDYPGSFCQALVQPLGRNGLRLQVDLPRALSLSPTSQHAVSVMLLHASHFLRMARAAARIVDGARAYGWQVALDRVATAREMEHALSALSVACRLSMREVLTFQQDESLARRYLAFRGWFS